MTKAVTKDFYAVGTNGDLAGLQIISGLLSQGWEIERVDTGGQRFIYLFSRPKQPQGPPLMLAAPKHATSTLEAEVIRVNKVSKRKPKKP